MTTIYRRSQAAKFASLLGKHLTRLYEEYPTEYNLRVPPETVAAKMEVALVAGSYGHEGRGMKATCKELGIPHTRKAIEVFLNGVQP